MSGTRTARTAFLSAAALALALLPAEPRAEEIVVSNYGVTVNGMPYAVAKALGTSRRKAPT